MTIRTIMTVAGQSAIANAIANNTALSATSMQLGTSVTPPATNASGLATATALTSPLSNYSTSLRLNVYNSDDVNRVFSGEFDDRLAGTISEVGVFSGNTLLFYGTAADASEGQFTQTAGSSLVFEVLLTPVNTQMLTGLTINAVNGVTGATTTSAGIVEFADDAEAKQGIIKLAAVPSSPTVSVSLFDADDVLHVLIGGTTLELGTINRFSGDYNSIRNYGRWSDISSAIRGTVFVLGSAYAGSNFYVMVGGSRVTDTKHLLSGSLTSDAITYVSAITGLPSTGGRVQLLMSDGTTLYTVAGVSNLYSINTGTAAATSIGAIQISGSNAFDGSVSYLAGTHHDSKFYVGVTSNRLVSFSVSGSTISGGEEIRAASTDEAAYQSLASSNNDLYLLNDDRAFALMNASTGSYYEIDDRAVTPKSQGLYNSVRRQTSIQDRSSLSSVSANDQVLISDTSDSGNDKRALVSVLHEAIPDASVNERGIIELANDVETTRRLDGERAVTPYGLSEAAGFWRTSIPSPDDGKIGDVVGVFFDGANSSENTSAAFNLHSENTNPSGITFQRGYTYVSDGNRAIFEYQNGVYIRQLDLTRTTSKPLVINFLLDTTDNRGVIFGGTTASGTSPVYLWLFPPTTQIGNTLSQRFPAYTDDGVLVSNVLYSTSIHPTTRVATLRSSPWGTNPTVTQIANVGTLANANQYLGVSWLNNLLWVTFQNGTVRAYSTSGVEDTAQRQTWAACRGATIDTNNSTGYIIDRTQNRVRCFQRLIQTPKSTRLYEKTSASAWTLVFTFTGS